MSIAKYVTVNNGIAPVEIKTTAATIGELFTAAFREDHNISDRGRPTLNGQVVDLSTPLPPDAIVGFQNGGSGKA